MALTLFFFVACMSAAQHRARATDGPKKSQVGSAWGSPELFDRSSESRSTSGGANIPYDGISGSGVSKGREGSFDTVDSMEVYDVYYAGGFADMISHTGRYEIIFARYTAEGRLLETRNITRTNALMMGYIDADPSASSVVFSMQEKPSSDVAIFDVPMSAKQEAAVRRVISEDALLSLCGDAQPCATASYFSASYAPDGSGRMAFAFRLWDPKGFAIGNQAIGILDKDGKPHALTYNSTRPFTNNTNSLDTCPRFHPADPSKIFHLRIGPSGATELLMFDLNNMTSVKVHINGSGVYSDNPSCPEFSLDNAGLLYIDGHFLENHSHLVLATSQGEPNSLTTWPLVDDPLTNSPIASGVLTFTNCQPLSPARGDVMCLNKYTEPTILHNSSSEVRWTTLSLPYTNQGWCKTNTCFRAFRRTVSRAAAHAVFV